MEGDKKMITFHQLNTYIKNGKGTGNMLILYSNDQFNISNILNYLKSKIDMRDLNVCHLDNIMDKNEILNACETLPLMSSKRLVILKSTFLNDEKNKKKTEIIKWLAKYKPPESTIFVLYFYQIDKRENINKNNDIKKLEKAGYTVVINNPSPANEAKVLLNSFLKKYNISLDKETQNFIVSNTSNIDVLINDLGKLKNMNDLSLENIKRTFCCLNDSDIFDLTKAISSKDIINSLAILNNLIESGENIIKILFMLIRQFKMLLYVKVSKEANLDIDSTAKKLKMHPYSCKILYSQCENFTITDLKNQLNTCIAYENKFKTIGYSQVDIELLLAKLM